MKKKKKKIFLWDQVPFTFSNSVRLLYLCLLNGRHWLLACSIDECMMNPMLFPNNSTVLPTPPCLLTLLEAMVEFTYRTRRIHVPLILPTVFHLWSLLNLEKFSLTGKDAKTHILGFLILVCASPQESLEVSFPLWMFERLSLWMSVSVVFSDRIEFTSRKKHPFDGVS